MQPGAYYPPPARFPRAPMVAIVVLTLLVGAAGLPEWPKPELSATSPWMVADVPGALWALVLGTTAVCVAVATVMTARAAGVGTGDRVFLAWLALVLLSAGALVWNALYAAALSTTSFGAIIPIFHWLFTFVPAVLAGALFTYRGRETRWIAALGTGMVTLPLFHLSSVLLVGGDLWLTAVGSLSLTGPLGVAPLVGGVALAGAMGERYRRGPQAYPSAG
jgi:hypothetical protein